MPSSAVRISFAGLSALLLASPIASVARTISWGGCDPSIVTDPSLQCGFLDVPLDYHDAGVGNARLALVKANATGERRGTVFFNPGGPGESGLENLNLLKDALLWRTGGVYDVVSWDPRGVGLSIPGHTRCFDSLEEYEAFFNGTLEANGLEYTGNFTDPADIQALLSQAPMMQEKYKELAQRCLDSPNGRYFRYLGTAATVRDLVSIADVIEGPDAPINYYGISYGTLLGAWFVNMFPDRVGRVVVDGVLDPVSFATLELPSGDWATQQYESADANYKGFITGCALAGPEGCAIASEGDGPLEINAKVQSLLKAAYHATRANASFPLTSGLIRARDLFPPMYAPWRWQNLANTVYPQDLAILEGNFSVPDPGLGGIDLLKYSIRTIICADSVDQSPLTNMTNIFEGMIEVAQTTTALFGGIWPNVGTQCSFWPVRSVERYQGPFNRKLANKILVASTTVSTATFPCPPN
ncbi:hypothetical protein C8Q76DRAFT_742305 [Earliella scabrosa]|nr:hypothetical protein C8Q76DRAFT_742305 [Earliella scabrosa]